MQNVAINIQLPLATRKLFVKCNMWSVFSNGCTIRQRVEKITYNLDAAMVKGIMAVVTGTEDHRGNIKKKKKKS